MVVVIDVLRASTTINQAAGGRGATAVIPCLEVEEARRIAAGLPTGMAVLGGEREGLRIPDFDLGNSPEREYRPARKPVGGQDGRVHHDQWHPRDAHLPGGFRRGAGRRVCELDGRVQYAAGGRPHPLALLRHARTEITREDALFAGARSSERACWPLGTVDETALNDQASLARAAWREASGGERVAAKGPSPAVLAAQLRLTNGGRNLKGIGLERDIDDAARIDRLSLVAELDLASWRLVPAKSA